MILQTLDNYGVSEKISARSLRDMAFLYKGCHAEHGITWDYEAGTHWLFYLPLPGGTFGCLLNGTRRMIMLSRFGTEDMLNRFRFVPIPRRMTMGALTTISKRDVHVNYLTDEVMPHKLATTAITRYLNQKDSIEGECYDVDLGQPSFPTDQDRVAYPAAPKRLLMHQASSIRLIKTAAKW